MRTLFYSLCLGSLILLSCDSSESEKENQDEIEVIDQSTDKEDLVDVKGNIYTEYYPGKKQIKFQGPQDDDKKRHGLWKFFNEKGKEISTTMYSHGLKHGHSVVKYDNGAIFYVGEYSNDEQIGIWKTYNENGTLNSEKDFGQAVNE